MVGIRMFVDEGLGHSSYLVDLGDRTAAILDPPRFPSAHLSAATAAGTKVVWTIDTHSHADYVTGSPALASDGDVTFLAAPDAGEHPGAWQESEVCAVVLQHAPGRKYYDGLEELELEIPALREEIELIRLYGARTLAVTLNSEQVEPAARSIIQERMARELGIPAVWPLEDGVAALMPALRALVTGAPDAR